MKIRKIIFALFFVFSLAILTSCTKKTEIKMSNKHKVIIDTDTAADDAMAIALLAKAPNIEILGITVLAGNVDLEQGCKNALQTLEVANRSDIKVYKGSNTTFDGTVRETFSVFGTDGMGDLNLINPKKEAETTSGIDFIIESVKNNPNEVEIITLGPATNIALAMEKDPTTMKKVKRIYSMGTTGFGVGNATPVAEFNVYSDALAYKYMMDFDIDTTIIGYDVCNVDDFLFYEKDLKEMAKISDLGNFISKASTGLVNFYKSNGLDFITLCDPIASAAIIFDEFVSEYTNCASYVHVNNDPCYGQVLFYKEGFTYDSMPKFDSYNVHVTTKLNSKIYLEGFKKLLK